MSRKHDTIVAPSLLAGNFAHFAESEKKIAQSGAHWMHLDIMDGHFVPNLSFGSQTLEALRSQSSLFFDTHLMLDNPHLYIESFAKAGAQSISIHVEPAYPIAETLTEIRKLGLHCGIALNPNTPVKAIEDFLDCVDIVLIMTVEPGFGGQKFRKDVLPKIAQVNAWREERCFSFRIEVDGGIDVTTGQWCWEQGADTLVAGTAFFKSKDPKEFCNSFKAFESKQS